MPTSAPKGFNPSPILLPDWIYTNARRSMWLTVVALSAAVFVQRFTYADGGNFFLQNLVQHHISTWDPWRQLAHVLTQGPMGLGMALGVRSVVVLAWLNGAGLFFVPLLLLWPCRYVVPATHPGVLALVAASYLHVQINASLFIISEAHVALSLIVFVALYLVFFFAQPQPGGGATAIDLWAVVAATLAIAAYETVALFAPGLLVLAAVRLREAQQRSSCPRRRAALAAVACALLGAFCFGAYGMAFNRGRTVGDVGLLDTISRLLADPTAWATSLVTAACFASCLWPAARRRPVAWRLAVVCFVLGTLLGTLPLWHDAFLPASLHYGARLFTIAWPLCLLLLLGLCRNNAHIPLNGPLVACVACLLGWNASWYAATSLRWLQYRAQVVATVSTGPTVQRLSDTVLRNSPFVQRAQWTLPTQSILEQALRGRAARALVVADKPGRFAPVVAEVPAQWPDLSEYGLKPLGVAAPSANAAAPHVQ